MKKICLIKPELYLPNDLVVVGSGKILLQEAKGVEIDNSNFVVRINFPEIDTYKNFTGTKTSLMIANNHVYLSYLEDKEISDPRAYQPFIGNQDANRNLNFNRLLIISPYLVKKTKKNNKSFFFLEGRPKQFYLTFKFLRYPNIFFSLIKILLKKNFSVGFCFILLTIASGIKVKTFGIDLEEDMTKRECYYKKQAVGPSHNLGREHKILKKLKLKHLIDVN